MSNSPTAVRWALVTGASGGLGRGFADHLAARGLSLALTGRRREALDEVAAAAQRRGVETRVIPGDLSTREFREQLLGELAEQGCQIDTLINNAGFGMLGKIAESDEARLAEMLRVNVEALTHLTRALLPPMLAAGHGTIINVASTASFQPLAGMAAYAASKSYVLSFTQALWHETRGTGVDVLALCPGATETGFFDAAGDDSVLTRRRTPEQVVRTAFDAVAAKKPQVVDGALNKAGAIAARLAPSRFAIEVGARIVES